MKRLILSLVVLFVAFSGASFADNIVTANQGTVYWDAVTTLDSGLPIPDGDVIKYQVYVRNDTAGTPVEKSGSEITATSATLTFSQEGVYRVGLQTIRYNQAGEVLEKSIIGWSDDSAVCQDGEIFGFRYFEPPSIPKNLRPSNE